MTRYEVVIYWSDQDQTFVAEAPELSGCASRGSTQEAALAAVKEAIRLWVEMAKELGHLVPHAKGRRLTPREPGKRPLQPAPVKKAHIGRGRPCVF